MEYNSEEIAEMQAEINKAALDLEQAQAEIRRLHKVVINLEKERENFLGLANLFKETNDKIRKAGKYAQAEIWAQIFLKICCQNAGQNLIINLEAAIENIKEDYEKYVEKKEEV